MRKILRWTGYFISVFATSVAVVFFIAWLKRDEIKQEIVERISERLNGTVSVGTIHFTVFHRLPNFSVSLRDVEIRDTVLNEAALTAKRIYLDIGLYELFRRHISFNKVSIEDGMVNLFVSANGYRNTSVFRAKPRPSLEPQGDSSTYSLNIESLDMRNVAITFHDSVKNKRISFDLLNTKHKFEKVHPSVALTIDGKIRANELTFNADAGSFLTGKDLRIRTRLEFDTETKQLDITPTTLSIDKNSIGMEGSFSFNDSATYVLKFQASDIQVGDVLPYLTPRIQKVIERFTIEKEVSVEVVLRGIHNEPREPEADVLFTTKGANFRFEKLEVEGLVCKGNYLHRPPHGDRKDNSSVVIEKFSGKIEEMNVTGNATFSRLQDPIVDLSLRSKLDHLALNKLVDTTEWIARSGTFHSTVEYKGRVEEYLDTKRSKYAGKLRGEFLAKNASLLYKAKKLDLTRINALCKFTEKQFSIDSLSVHVNGNPVHAKGTMSNYIPFFIQPANKGIVKLELYSPNLDLSFIANESNERKTIRKIDPGRQRIAGVVNTVQKKLQFDISVIADDISYMKFKASGIRGKVRLDAAGLEASDIRMKVANGTMFTRFTFKHDNITQRHLSTITRIEGADIREFFELFNDFNQNTIQARNLSGKISATANFSANILPDYRIDAKSMKGRIVCKITDGRLLDFEPLQNISNFLFRKRDFTDVQFAELNSNFDVNGLDIDIDKMEVQSNVLSFFLLGRYSFDDSTSMSLQLPLSNLKKRDRNYKPENIGTDGKTGMSVYLHVYRDKDDGEKINIAYDPFKKWVKKAEAESRKDR